MSKTFSTEMDFLPQFLNEFKLHVLKQQILCQNQEKSSKNTELYRIRDVNS